MIGGDELGGNAITISEAKRSPIIQLATCSLATEQATHTFRQNASNHQIPLRYQNPSYRFAQSQK